LILNANRPTFDQPCAFAALDGSIKAVVEVLASEVANGHIRRRAKASFWGAPASKQFDLKKITARSIPNRTATDWAPPHFPQKIFFADHTDGFCSKFARAHCAVKPSEFWGVGSPRWPSAAMVAQTHSDQTNNKQTTLRAPI
jgi:hypothetical protein